MRIKLIIEADIPDEQLNDFKKLEHHLEYTGILENYPDMENVHCDVHNMEYKMHVYDEEGKHIDTMYFPSEKTAQCAWEVKARRFGTRPTLWHYEENEWKRVEGY